MKKVILLFIFASFFSSCNNDDESVTELRGKATFKVDATQKEFTKANSFNNGVLALGNSSDEIISLFFPIPSTFPTTYDMDTEEIVTASYVLDGKTYNATNGISGIGQNGLLTITVTEYSDSKISGTFGFTGVNDENSSETIVVTEGTFNEIPDL